MKEVKTPNSTVEIGAIAKSSFKKMVLNYQQVIVLVDENTHQLTRLLPLEVAVSVITIKQGEDNKNITTCQYVWQKLNELNVTRSAVLINLGGGVVTDLGGFVASTYKRGIDFINIPTSLLSMVDASVGGKTGVNFNHLKNNIGTFNEPLAVYCDSSFLNSLPQRELISGIGEVLKHALIADKNYWDYIKKTPFEQWNIDAVVATSVEIKNKIVTADPFEKDLRKLLNFGHTIGHAIESLLLDNNTPVLHGEAVAMGILGESHIAFQKELLSEKMLNEISEAVLSFFDAFSLPDTCSIIDRMAHDKKNINTSSINFTLINGIGKASINHTASIKEIEKAIEFIRITHTKI